MLTLIGGAGGSWIKDKIKSEGTDAANAVRILHLEEYKDKHTVDSVHRAEYDKLEAEAVKRPEFDQFMSEVLRRLDRIDRKLDYVK